MYRKYAWVGNRIDSNDMAKLHHIKETTGKQITQMVAEVVSQYLKSK